MTSPSTSPAVSIVIPTHNRRASVERTLRALAGQTYPLRAIEVIVVADGCTDGTPRIADIHRPIAVRVIEQSKQGAAAARNRGAGAASADLLIFLDDDVEAWPELVAAHVRAHGSGGEPSVAIGYLPPELQGRRDFFAIMLRAWWEAMFERMREPGHRFVYSDLLSGNFSVGRALFTQVGGFDESLRCHEDYELGLRLIAAGARLRFAGDAAGRHHEYTTVDRAFQRKRDEGRADVTLARRYPALTSALPLSAEYRTRAARARALRRLALTSPAAGDPVARGYRWTLAALERLGLRMRWRRLLDDLLSYWYWRGVGESLGGAPLDTLPRATELETGDQVYELDLRIGIDAAMRALDAAAPQRLRLRWGALLVGDVPAVAGAEPLQGRHLPALLRDRFALQFGETLARAEELGDG